MSFAFVATPAKRGMKKTEEEREVETTNAFVPDQIMGGNLGGTL